MLKIPQDMHTIVSQSFINIIYYYIKILTNMIIKKIKEFEENGYTILEDIIPHYSTRLFFDIN